MRPANDFGQMSGRGRGLRYVVVGYPASPVGRSSTASTEAEPPHHLRNFRYALALSGALEQLDAVESASVVEEMAEAEVWARLGCTDVLVVVDFDSKGYAKARRLSASLEVPVIMVISGESGSTAQDDGEASDAGQPFAMTSHTAPLEPGSEESRGSGDLESVYFVEARTDPSITAVVIQELLASASTRKKHLPAPGGRSCIRAPVRRLSGSEIRPKKGVRGSGANLGFRGRVGVALCLSLDRGAGATTLALLLALGAQKRSVCAGLVDLDPTGADFFSATQPEPRRSPGFRRWLDARTQGAAENGVSRGQNSGLGFDFSSSSVGPSARLRACQELPSLSDCLVELLTHGDFASWLKDCRLLIIDAGSWGEWVARARPRAVQEGSLPADRFSDSRSDGSMASLNGDLQELGLDFYTFLVCGGNKAAITRSIHRLAADPSPVDTLPNIWVTINRLPRFQEDIRRNAARRALEKATGLPVCATLPCFPDAGLLLEGSRLWPLLEPSPLLESVSPILDLLGLATAAESQEPAVIQDGSGPRDTAGFLRRLGSRFFWWRSDRETSGQLANESASASSLRLPTGVARERRGWLSHPEVEAGARLDDRPGHAGLSSRTSLPSVEHGNGSRVEARLYGSGSLP
jgi:hypothetical protein